MTYQDPYRRPPEGWRPVAVNADPVEERAPAASGVPPRRIDAVLVFAIVGFVVLAVVAVIVGGYLVLALGTTATVVAALMALVPMVAVVLVVSWIDRWEPEPRVALLFAFLWGAAASVAIALIFSFGAQLLQEYSGTGGTAAADFFATVVQAPIVEEGAKGLGVLLIFWVYRRNFEGPVDGIVYAAMVAVGFAFTENIQYFGLALANSGPADVGQIFFLRAILSPFAHVMFTVCTGVALGYASRRTGAGGAIGYFLLGLIPAVLLHAFWNGMSFVVTDFFGYYFTIQVPLFLIGAGLVVFLRRQEQRITAARLAEYADAGWFTRTEAALLASGAGRSQSQAWATRFRLGPAHARFVRDATRLAFARQRIVSSRDRAGGQRAEADLLARLTEDRRALATLPPMPLR